MNRGLQVIHGLGALFVFGGALQAAEAWSVWDHGADLAGRQLAVAFRDGTCSQGNWSATEGIFYADQLRAKDGSITPKTQIKVRREEVVRISEWWTPPAVKDLLYSARSSWSDVGEIATVWREQVSVTTKQGKELHGKASGFTADSIQINDKRISRLDIRTVDYLRYKPLTSKQEYLIHEQASLLDVRLWFKRWLVPMIRVRVFDSTAPESNASICTI